MPTICDLKAELKKKNIKGITGLNKTELQQLLDTGKAPKKENKKNESKKEVKEEEVKPKKEEKPILLLKLKPNETPKTKGKPPLANKTLVELYKMRLNLEKTIKDDVNSAEAQRSKTILEKVNSAYAYNRKEYMDKINGLNKQKLEDLKEELLKQYDKSKDDDADKIYRGMIGEVNKLL